MVEARDLGTLLLDGVPAQSLSGSRPQRLLLVALLVCWPEAVSADRLSEFAWPGEPPVRRRIWDNVHRLRASLRSADLDVDVTSGTAGYTLDRPIRLDSHRFEELVGADGAAGQHDQLERLEEALGLWRGRPYDGYDVDVLAPGLTERLIESHRRATLRWARARLQQGRRDVGGPLEKLAAEHPYDEEVVEMLVRGLRANGRRVDALRRLQRFRSELQADLGLEVGSRLSSIERELVLGDASPPIEPQTRSMPLPRWRTSFLDRRSEMAELIALIESTPTVTVTGPAGVGKTRLAVETLRATTGNGRFVDLGVISNPESIWTVAADSCGVRAAQPREALLDHLQTSPTVLLVDNCEHLLEAAGLLVDDLLVNVDGLRVVSTSRKPLGIDGESVLRLSPLNVDVVDVVDGISPAATLFCQRADLDPRQLSDGDRRAVTDIATRLDGLPLAIELAAPRARTMNLFELASALDDRYDLVGPAGPAAPSRHRNLQAALDWSHEQLGSDRRSVLARCSVFAGRFTLDDAAAVCSDPLVGPELARSAVVDLADASLIDYQPEGVPYRLLQTVRTDGRRRLADEGEQERWPLRHARYFTERACGLTRDSFGPAEAAILDGVLARSDEYRAAIVWLRANRRWDLLADLVWGLSAITFSMRGSWVEPLFLVSDVAFQVPDPVPERWYALVANVASTLHRRGLFEASEQAAARAVELAPDRCLPWVHASAAAAPGDPALAIHRADTGLRCAHPRRPEEVLHALWALSNAQRLAGDVDDAIETAERLVAEAQRFETERGESIGLVQVARARPAGWPGAAQHARRAFHLATSSRTDVARITAAMQHVRHLLADDTEDAREALVEYLDLPIVQTPFGLRIIVAATAYLAVVGQIGPAGELAAALGGAAMQDFADFPAVERICRDIAPTIDPMSVEAARRRALTATVRARLASPG